MRGDLPQEREHAKDVVVVFEGKLLLIDHLIDIPCDLLRLRSEGQKDGAEIFVICSGAAQQHFDRAQSGALLVTGLIFAALLFPLIIRLACMQHSDDIRSCRIGVIVVITVDVVEDVDDIADIGAEDLLYVDDVVRDLHMQIVTRKFLAEEFLLKRPFDAHIVPADVFVRSGIVKDMRNFFDLRHGVPLPDRDILFIHIGGEHPRSAFDLIPFRVGDLFDVGTFVVTDRLGIGKRSHDNSPVGNYDGLQTYRLR